jgi:hypothetical protein
MSKNDSVETFAKIIASMSAQGPGKIPLFNIVFFVGAGFSKSWDQRLPTGLELFKFDARDIMEEYEWVDHFLSSNGYQAGMQLDYANLKDLVHNLSIQRRFPSLRTRYIDINNISIVLNELKAIVYKRFSDLAPINYFDLDNQKFPLEKNVAPNQKKILDFFDLLGSHQDGSEGIPAGIRLHFVTTNYDFTLETILDNSIYDWEGDSIFNYTYRGFTPIEIHGLNIQKFIHDHYLVGNLIKINGGFEIYPKRDGYELNYTDQGHKEISQNPPNIILPTREQDYTENYFSWIFPKAIRLLQESNILVIVGYSMPEEDAMLRFLIKQFAENLGDAAFKFLFYIDRMNSDEQKVQLGKVFPYLEHDSFDHSNVYLYQGDFAEWADAATVALEAALKKKYKST